MSNTTDYDYWTLRTSDVRMMPPIMRFATRQEARNARAAFRDPSCWKLVHVVNRRKKAEAQRDELLTLARGVVALEVRSVSAISGEECDAWAEVLMGLIAQAKLVLEKVR